MLPGESQEDYQALLASYTGRFLPADQVEMDLVESLAVSRWRLRRVANIETQILAQEMAARASRQAADVEEGCLEVKDLKDNDQYLASAFQFWRDSLTSLTRYENSLNHAFDRALKQLQVLQKSRPAPLPEELPNEPKPAFSLVAAPCPPPTSPVLPATGHWPPATSSPATSSSRTRTP